MKDFNAFTTELAGANLVEASAGTGKTYSVAILSLRLIVEKDIPISRILMVTFTNNAVAEMAERIRKFLKLALRKAEGKTIDEQNISKYIEQVLDKGIISKEVLKLRLIAALGGLDESAIQTIHSFCQDTLTSEAFDTGQAFGLTLKENLSEVAAAYVQEFWRNEITGLDNKILIEWSDCLKLKFFNALIKEILGEKEYFHPLTNLSTPDEYFLAKDVLENLYSEKKNEICENVIKVKISGFSENKKQKFIQDVLCDCDAFHKWLKEKKTAKYQIAILDSLFTEELEKYQNVCLIRSQVLHLFAWKCINYVKPKIKTYIKQNHFLTYNDMINKLHEAVMKEESGVLRKNLSQRFDAIFIDEFQDTDKLQYEIYDTLFSEGKILFYIGDPKQSIYGWRKADLNTYHRAFEKHKDNGFTMSTNFRSSKAYVAAMNKFFSLDNPFLTDKIPYHTMVSHDDVGKVGLEKNGNPLPQMQVFLSDTKESINKEVADLVEVLLRDGCTLNGETLKRSDIGILVRTKREGKALKNGLDKKGIHAINIDETKVFETDEARQLMYILESVLNISWKSVNKGLLNNFTCITPEELLLLDEDKLLAKFSEYGKIWMVDGISAMMRRYMADFDVLSKLQNATNTMGLRRLSTLNQLLEVIQEAAFEYELKPNGLLTYLQKQLGGGDNESDTYLQRLESDEEAVIIMTIHKAKGLEFSVVIAPYLDMVAKEKFDFSSYRNEHGKYLFYPNEHGNGEPKQLFIQQLEEENRRLLYVAVTRAKYNCFLFRLDGSKSQGKATALKPFIDNISSSEEINISRFDWKIENQRNEDAIDSNLELRILNPNFNLPDANWRKMSFSFLTQHGKATPKIYGSEQDNEYDQFIFQTLPRGTSLGDMLHYIFERVNFKEDSNWEEVVKRSLERYYPQYQETFLAHLLAMVKQVTNVSLNVDGESFTLQDVDPEQLVSELEFDLPIKNFNTGGILGIPREDAFMLTARAGQELKGLLNGFVDLFFQHNGKYYILDWKSNYLGDQLEHYNYENMLQAMNDNNYHLQYLLYSLGIKQYLTSRVPGFDFERDFGGVVYLFLRGIRQNESSGVFTVKPTLEQMEYLEDLVLSSEYRVLSIEY